MPAPPSYPAPAGFGFHIRRAAAFDQVWPAYLDPETGEGFDFTTDPAGTWTARMEVRDITGARLTGFHTRPLPAGKTETEWPGVLTLTASGHPVAHLSSVATAALPTLTRFAEPGTGTVFADLQIIDPADGEVYVDYVGTGTISQEVTSA